MRTSLTATPAGATLPDLPAGALTQADNDRHLVALWLARPNLSRRTVRSCRKEADRFLAWCGAFGLELRTVRYEHLLAYAAFLADPQPAADWIAPAKYPRSDPRWRPFLGPLSEASQRQALVILKGLFAWAVAARYLPDSPAKLLGNMVLNDDEPIARFLPIEAIAYLVRAVDALPAHHPAERLRQARSRFVILAYYQTAARLSELVQADMRNIRRDHHGLWWLHVLGKGRKRGRVPITAALLAEFKRYRLAWGLSTLPHVDEDRPLLMSSRGQHRRATTYTVARVIKSAMQTAAELAAVDGQAELAHQLSQASAHWLRHSSLTHQLDNGVSLKTVQKNARHANIKTTSRYLHREDQKRHSETASAIDLAIYTNCISNK